MPADDRRRADDLQLDRIEATLEDVLREARKTNGRVTRLEDTLFGAAEGRIRHGAPGVVDRVNDHGETIRTLQNAHGEASAVGRTFKAVVVVGVSVGSMMLTALGLLLSIYWGGA